MVRAEALLRSCPRRDFMGSAAAERYPLDRLAELSCVQAERTNFSTRDMARLGYLMLRQGNWNGRQLVPVDWVIESTRAFTPLAELNPPDGRSGPYGYGYLWWVWDGPHATGAFDGAYGGHGAFGQYIIVIPKLDLVVAHKTRPDLLDAQGNTRGVWASDLDQILDALVRTHCGASCP